MKNKRGWLRIFEASLAIVLLTGVVLYVYNQQQVRVDNSDFFYNLETKLLNDFAENPILRESVFAGDNVSLAEYANKSISSGYGFGIRICGIEETCGLGVLASSNVYVKDRIFASNVTDYSPRKVRLFIWQK